jgi:hypothetical protein
MNIRFKLIGIVLLLTISFTKVLFAQKKMVQPKQKYDIAAFVWPAYHPDERAKLFWPDGIGEWQTVMNNTPKFAGHEQPRYPLWGYINEADPYVAEMEINAAADHGVNVFIFDWYWYDGLPFLEGHLNDGYLKARNNDRVKFYLMWANHDVNMTWDKRNAGKSPKNSNDIIWKGSVDRQEFEVICRRVIEKYFSHPSYYQVDGKPSFMIYELPLLIKGLGGIEETKDALNWFRAETKKAGFKGLDLQLTLRRGLQNISGVDGNPQESQKEIIERLGFDGVTHYQYVHFTGIDKDYREIMVDVEKGWNKIDSAYKIPYYSHVSVGWDANPRYEMFRRGVVKNNTPENFKQHLLRAKVYVDAHPDQAPLITINSWNEWTETSYLQPCTMFGYGYLKAVKEVFVNCNKQ